MAKNNGIQTAQNNIFDQSDGAIDDRTKADTFGFGNVAAPAFDPTNGFMWTGGGQLATTTT